MVRVVRQQHSNTYNREEVPRKVQEEKAARTGEDGAGRWYGIAYFSGVLRLRHRRRANGESAMRVPVVARAGVGGSKRG